MVDRAVEKGGKKGAPALPPFPGEKKFFPGKNRKT